MVSLRMAIALMVVASWLTLSGSSPSGAQQGDVVPEHLRFLFELPWCKQWNFNCNKCEKKDGEIVCTRNDWLPQDSCAEDFSRRHCTSWSPPTECARWSDGCNICQIAPKRPSLNCSGPDDLCQKYRKGGYWSCTLMACDEHKSDRPSKFTCLRATDPAESK
jgi:hypothetical protein